MPKIKVPKELEVIKEGQTILFEHLGAAKATRFLTAFERDCGLKGADRSQKVSQILTEEPPNDCARFFDFDINPEGSKRKSTLACAEGRQVIMPKTRWSGLKKEMDVLETYTVKPKRKAEIIRVVAS